MAVEGINAFQNFSTAVNFHQSSKQPQTDKAQNFSQNGHTPLPSKKDYTTPVVVAAVALAALGTGIYAHKTGKLGSMFSTKVQKLNKKIDNVIEASMAEAKKVVSENCSNDIVNLPAVDAAAGQRSADITKAERFHQAATWIEEAYKTAFSKAALSDEKNMFNYIHEYMNDGRTALAQMYVQMPEAEANIRIERFVNDIKNIDSHTGMTSEKFVEDLRNLFMPQAREAIK